MICNKEDYSPPYPEYNLEKATKCPFCESVKDENQALINSRYYDDYEIESEICDDCCICEDLIDEQNDPVITRFYNEMRHIEAMRDNNGTFFNVIYLPIMKRLLR